MWLEATSIWPRIGCCCERCAAKTLPNRTSVAVCSELRELVGFDDACFGLISAGNRDGDKQQRHVVYWSNLGNGLILKGYDDKDEAERELKASIKARDSLPDYLRQHVPAVERHGEKAWLKLTPLGMCSLAECDWLFGLLPLEASEEQRVDLFDALKGHFEKSRN